MAGSQVADRLRLALEMYEFGEQMLRSRLRREQPDATDEQINAQVQAWRLDRPGAPHGDAVGTRSDRFA